MELEPAERNPAQLRRTALILVGIMIVGAVFVLSAYLHHEAGKDPARPPVKYKITKNFAAKNQHDKLVALYDLEGKVWFAVPICVSQLDENKHALAMMQELEKHYSANEDIRFVFVSIEGVDMGVTPTELMETANKLHLTSDRCWFLTTGDTTKQRGYIKDQLRLGLVNEREDGDPSGKWKFPSEIALVDRNLHIRQRYDFNEAYTFQVKAENEIKKRPEIKEEKGFDSVLYAVDRLKETLYINTNFVLEEIKTGSKK